MQLKSKLSVIAVFISVLSLSGCATRANVTYPSSKISSNHVSDKNYQLGKLSSVFIGDPIIKVKDYNVVKNEITTEMTASKSFILSGGLRQFPINQGVPLHVAGELEKDGKRLTVLDLPESNVQITVDDAGRPYKYVIADPHNLKVVMAYDFKPNVPDVVFFRKNVPATEAVGDGKNFEILYSGRTDKSINLTYREYTPDDMARSAFSQNLTYEANAKIIRFKNFQIQVVSVTNEKIDFRVISE